MCFEKGKTRWRHIFLQRYVNENIHYFFPVLRDDFRENPEPVTVAAGDSAAFHCKPPRGEPEPKVLWRKSGTPVAAGGRITATDEGDLLISSVQVTDAGDYTCLALNKGGERESVPATLTVLGMFVLCLIKSMLLLISSSIFLVHYSTFGLNNNGEIIKYCFPIFYALFKG